MKSIQVLLSSAMLVSSSWALASTMSDKALTFVPEGKVVQEKEKEVKIQTPKGSIVEVEFTRGGDLEEASGDSLDNDLFVPGEGLMPMKDAVAALRKSGKSPSGDWSLEKSMLKGWHYEFEGFENGKKMDYVVDAKSGKILESKVDN